MKRERLEISMLGNTRTGKTAFVEVFVDNLFPEATLPTLGVFPRRPIDLSVDDSKVRVVLFDYGSAVTFRNIRKFCYNRSGACVIMYELTDRTSFESLKEWIDEYGSIAEKGVPLTIIGNKLDKIRQDPAQRQVTFAEGQKFAQSVNAFFYEISVKTDGSTITQIIKELIKAYLRNTAIDKE